MKKFRECGCDKRDDTEYTQDATTSPLICDTCAEMPCCWVAQFGCPITCGDYPITAGDGNAYMRIPCPFTDDNCVFKSIQDYSHGNDIVTGSCPSQHGCTWFRRLFNDTTKVFPNLPGFPVGTVTLNDFTWGWSLDLSAATPTLDHALSGISYELETGSIDCTGPNTFIRTDSVECTGVPRRVCVIPLIESMEGTEEPGICNPTSVVEHDCCDENNIPCYDTEENRRACGDECCNCLPEQSVTVTCGECSQTNTVAPCVGGGNDIQGVDNPVGPTYGACETFCGYEVCLNFYCRGVDIGWAVDVYFDDVFCATIDMAEIPAKCPLDIGEAPSATCGDCSICVGTGCEPCDCSTLLADLANVTVSSSGGGSTTLPVVAIDWQALTTLDTLPVTLVFACVDATNYTLAVTYENGNPGYPGNANYTSASGVCNPLEAVFNNVDLGDGVLKTITVTA